MRGLVLVETALAPQVTTEERAGMLAALDADYQGLLRAAYESFGRDSTQGIELYHEVAGLDSTSIKPWIRLALSADLSHEARALRVPVLAALAERSWEPGESWLGRRRGKGARIRRGAPRHADSLLGSAGTS